MTWIELPEDHPTPSLVVDSQTVHRNLERMQSYCGQHGLKLRPHTKTHKSIEMARRQIELGAGGLTVAKVGEGECMSEASNDLFLAYPTVGRSRLERLGRLARRCIGDLGGKLSVGVDSKEGVEAIAEVARRVGVPIGILADLDVGFHRTGIESGNLAEEFCAWIASQPGIRFEGVMCFPGHILPNATAEAWKNYSERLESVIEGLRRQGIEVTTVSGGSTPTAKESHRNPVLNEIRPGTYIYNDWNEVRLGVAEIEDCAARVAATVVSVPARNKCVLDCGSKTLSSDRNCVDPEGGFGVVMEFPDAKITRLSEEHGEVTFSEEYSGPRPYVGQRVWVLPNHICVCVNLQNYFFLAERGELTEIPVDARGLLV